MAAQTTARRAKANSARTRASATNKAKKTSRKAASPGGLTGVTSGLLSQVDLLGVKSAARLAAVSAALGAAAGALARPLVSKRRKPTRTVSIGSFQTTVPSLGDVKKQVKRIRKVLP